LSSRFSGTASTTRSQARDRGVVVLLGHLAALDRALEAEAAIDHGVAGLLDELVVEVADDGAEAVRQERLGDAAAHDAAAHDAHQLDVIDLHVGAPDASGSS
jgi:hypothetical protein